MATSRSELAKLVVTLVGEDSDYQQTLNDAVGTTKKASSQIEATTQKAAMAQARSFAAASRAANAATAPVIRNEKAVKKNAREMAKASKVTRVYGASVAGLKASYAAATAGALKFGTAMKATGKGMRNTGLMMSLGVSLPLAGAGAAMLKAAADAEETQNKFDVVFASVADKANKSAAMLDASYGMSSVQARKLMSDTGDLLTGFGFTADAALDLSVRTQKLATDLASFTNIEGGAERASEALTKAMLGETEQAKALGVVIRQDSDEFKDLVKQFQETKGMTLLQAKAMTALTIATKQSKNAMGDYHRSQGSATNQTREFIADVKDVAVQFGQTLMPAFRMALSWARRFVEWLKGMDERFRKIIVIVAAVAAAIGPIMALLGPVISTIGALISPLGLVLLKIGAIAAAIYVMVEAIWGPGSFVEAIKTGIAWAMAFAKSVIGFFLNIKHNWGVITAWLRDNWKNLLWDSLAAIVIFVKNSVYNAGVMVKLMLRLWTYFFGWIVRGFEKIFSKDFMRFIGEGIRKAAKALVDFAKRAWNTLKGIFSSKKGKKAGLAALADQLGEDMVAGFSDESFVGGVGRIIKEETANLKSGLEGFKATTKKLTGLKLDLKVEEPKDIKTAAKDAAGAAGTGKKMVSEDRATNKLATASQVGTQEAFKLLASQRNDEKKQARKNAMANKRTADGIDKLNSEGVTLKDTSTPKKL